MSFNEVKGQERARRMLQNGLINNKLSHAYIFSGPKGTGRRRMAKTLAQAIYCLNRQDDACGECLECRKIEHGNHPDYHWIEPDGTTIKIDRIRELQKEFAYRSTAAQTKIYVLDDADRMTVQAANSLLKFLEEPQSDVVAILITENGQALLPTIQSRAQWIPFVPLPPQIMSGILTEEGFSEHLVRPAVQLEAGVEAARELVRENWFAEARNVVIQLAKEAQTALPAAMLTVQQKVMKTDLADHLTAVLDLLLLWFKDLVQIRFGRMEQAVYIDQLDWMTRHVHTRDADYWVSCMERITEVQRRLRTNANPQLTLEKLLTDLQGE